MLASLFGRRFWITAYVLLVAGFVLPGDYSWLRSSIPFLLGGILFFSCLKVAPREIILAVRQQGVWLKLGWLSIIKLVVLPLIAWGLTYLVAPQWAPGILLMSLMPAGFSSMAFADLYHGNRLTALLLMLMGSAIVPFSVPFFLSLCTGSEISLAASLHEASYVGLLLFCPFVAAMLTRSLLPQFTARYHDSWSHWSIASVCALIFVAAAVNRTSWAHLSLAELSLPLALTSGAMIIFVVGGWLQGRLLERSDGVAFTCTAIYMNNGLGVAFASKFYPNDPYMVLPSIIVQFPLMACIVLVGWLFTRSRE